MTDLWQPCGKCKQDMEGVRAGTAPARRLCEKCGGNTTEYSAERPRPEKDLGRKRG